jgi:oligopeptide/dipeptide ABC transporter ATP-binding protein
MTAETLLEVRDLHVQFGSGDRAVRAVNGVDFSLCGGERLAIVGESGSGKSVMSLALLRLLPRNAQIPSGEVLLDGKPVFGLTERELGRIRGRRAAMVFQDPMSSLNPVLRIGRQIIAPQRRHLGISVDAAHARGVELLAEVGLPDPERAMRAYPHELSGGMRQRVLIAMALSCKPSLIIADEPTTALDVTVQAQIIRLLTRLSEEHGVAMILVTHDLGIVARFAQRVAVMYGGRFVEIGSVDQIFQNPQHPYTQGLLRSIPRAGVGRKDLLYQIDGFPPDPTTLPLGCAFGPRCAWVTEDCRREVPQLTERDDSHHARCLVTDADAQILRRQVELNP